MNPNSSELDDLLAAWALGALDPVEHAAIDRLVDDDPLVGQRAREMRDAVTMLDAHLKSSPPPEIGLRILEQAGDKPPKLADPSTPVELLAHQIDALGELLADLQPLDWRKIAEPYEWSVQGLVAHLLVIEHYVAALLGLVDETPSTDAHLDMGADWIAHYVEGPPIELARAWMDRARMNLDAVSAGQGLAMDCEVNFHGWTFTVERLLVVRAFEVWTHADDIRRVIGKALYCPLAGDLRTMSAVSIATLSPLLSATSPGLLQSARVVLTGAGGGTFDIGEHADDSTARQVTLVTDVVDYCHRVAGRLAVQDLEFTAEGDTNLAHELLNAASAFAV